MSTILIVLLVIIVLGALPMNGFHSYGWGPSGVVGVLLVVLLVLVLMGRV